MSALFQANSDYPSRRMADNFALCWQNLSAYVTVKEKKLFGSQKTHRLKLVSNVSGVVHSGTLSAIIGPSGAGKTTLLASISQRFAGETHGTVNLNGCPVDKDLMIRMSGFVPQDDLAIQALTVIEHLQFMASLKLDKRVSKVQKNRIIMSLIQDLGLSNCTYTRLFAVSGGERKRIALAVQLLTDPPLLLCDEPTTGLDSSTAVSVITLLRSLATKGKLVLCSIHQPASGIFEMFDTVTLLVPGGRLAYFGDVTNTNSYFSELGLVCPPAYNTAEYVVKQLNMMPDKLNEDFLASKDFVGLHKHIESITQSSLNTPLIFGMEEKFLKFYSVQKPSLITQLQWLVWRSYLQLYRSSQKIILRLFMYVITALLIATPFIGIKFDQEGIQNVQGLNYSVMTETIFSQAYAVLHTFPGEIPVLLREMGNGVYQPAPYYLSKVVILVVRVIIETTLFCSIIYAVVGRNESTIAFMLFALPIVVSGIASSAYGFCVSTMFENVNTATLMTVPVDLISYVFSGLFLQLASTPIYFSWIKYVSRFYYGMEAISILQWQEVENIPCSKNPNIPCVSSGEDVLMHYGYGKQNLLFDFSGLFAMFFILHVLGYYFLKKRSKRHSVY